MKANPFDTYSTADGQNTGIVLKNSAVELCGWYFYNNASAIRVVKLYDQLTVPTSSDVPKLRLVIPANSGANILTDSGITFHNGLCIRVVTGIADSDNTAPTANDVVVNLFYR